MKKSNRLVSIIVVNHNGKKFLPNFFESVFCQTYKNLEILMVDNNSEDDSVRFVEKNFPKVKIIKNKDNSGYAGGNNIGYKKCAGEYVIVINNDVVLENDLIESLLVAFDEIPKLGAVQPMVKLMGDPEGLDACGSFWTNTGFNYHYGIYKNSSLAIYNKSFPVYSLKGVCMMIPRKVIEEIGLFDDDFWCYFEETDFCHRVWLAGYECWYYPKSFLYHYMGGTRLKKAEAFVQFHSFKNRLCSYLKNLGKIEMIKVLPVYLLMTFIWGIMYLLKFNFLGFFAIIKSFFWNLKNLRRTMHKRNYIQGNLRKVDDTLIFKKTRRNPNFSYYYYLLKSLENYAD